MSLDTAKKCVDTIFKITHKDIEDVEITFIGGEPLLRFDLIRTVFDYACQNKGDKRVSFFASTNGVPLNEEMKEWFSEKKDVFCLGLSLDGTPETHNKNRNNSFDKLDLDFFLRTYPNQNAKMTVSEHSVSNFAENIEFIHSMGFGINGADFCDGTYDWSDSKFIEAIIPQLKRLVSFYISNPDIKVNQLFSKDISLCASTQKHRKKCCGAGDRIIFFETDGSITPCSFITSMTFNESDMKELQKVDYSDHERFVDDDCYKNCYIYPICNTCIGADYLANRMVNRRDRRKCQLRKLVALFIADFQAKRIIQHPEQFDQTKLYRTIEAIKTIRELYLPEFGHYLS